jgi:4-carboxymuconolactone decarboxylase
MRLPPPEPSQMSPRQREVAQSIESRQDDSLRGPYLALLHSPEVAERAHALAQHLRFGLRVPERLRALAVLVAAARHDKADATSFAAMEDIRASGLAADKISALAEGRKPADLDRDEELAYAFCHHLVTTGRVRSADFEGLVDRFDRAIALEFVATCGYTAFLTTLSNIAETQSL